MAQVRPKRGVVMSLTAGVLGRNTFALPQDAAPTASQTIDGTATSTSVSTGTLSPDSTTAQGLPTDFPKVFTTAFVVAVVAVGLGLTLCCVLALCWRPLFDRWLGDRKPRKRDPGSFYIRGNTTNETGAFTVLSNGRNYRNTQSSEAWFCGTDRGLPVSQNEHNGFAAWDSDVELRRERQGGEGENNELGKKQPSTSVDSVVLGKGVEEATMPPYEPYTALQ